MPSRRTQIAGETAPRKAALLCASVQEICKAKHNYSRESLGVELEFFAKMLFLEVLLRRVQVPRPSNGNLFKVLQSFYLTSVCNKHYFA